MPTVTRSGHHVRCPPLPDAPTTRSKAANIDTESDTDNIKSPDPPKRPCPHHAGPKSVIANADNDPEESFATRHRPLPKPRPLAWSKCSGPMTSSTEEEIFEAIQQSRPFHGHLADEEVPADTQDGDVELTPALVTEAHTTAASKDPNPSSESQSNDPNGGTSATPTVLHDTGHGSEDHGNNTSAACAESHDAEDDENNSATSAKGRPCRSGGVKSYAPDHSDGEESSPSDSDWAAGQEQHKKAQRAVDDAAANDGDDDEGSPASDPPSPSWLTATQKQKSKVMVVEVNKNHNSKDKDNEDFVKTKGGMPQAAGLTMKATQKESLWNQHQTWFAAARPPPKGTSGVVLPVDLKAWKVKQRAHYKAHPHGDPQHISVWKEILENWDSAVTGSTQDLTSRSAAGLMMAVCDAFAKLGLTMIKAAYWHRTHGIHIAGVAIFPSDEEAGRQASGLFSGSDMVKALINSHQLDIKHWLDELTTILKYKDLEAAHAEGKTFSLLPPSSTALNSTLLCNGKPARDRNRKVAPMIITEAGHPLKTSNSRWLTMLDILYAKKLCIHDWPAGVPPPGPDFELKALSASQLCALVASYLRIHLGAMYKADLGLDDDDDDSEAEAMKVKKRKSKSKKSHDNGRKKGPIAEEPSMVLHISRWPESDTLALETQSTNTCLIPLVIDTDSKVVRSLQDSEKFVKDLLQDNTPRCCTNEVIKKPAMSNPAASRSTVGTSRPTQAASHSNQEASRFKHAAPSSNREALHFRQHTNRAIYEDILPSLPPQEAPRSYYSHLQDAIYPSRSQYNGSRNEALRHQHAYNDVMPMHNPDIHKQTRPHYESARETEDLECKTVEDRHRARVHDNLPISLPQQPSSSPIYTQLYEMIQGTMYVGTQIPEDNLAGWMDVNVEVNIDGDVLMEILQPDDELEQCMDMITPKPEEGLVGWMDVDLDCSFNIKGDVIMEIIQTDDELEWLKDVDGDIVMHESMVIEQAA
ncbi:hypothetical protein EDB19DRAFT_1824642 [Suillus lakei]|nr:hypothetical protein EDB19DRAFT_1824642 [Suillus lakei]